MCGAPEPSLAHVPIGGPLLCIRAVSLKLANVPQVGKTMLAVFMGVIVQSSI